MKKNSFIEGALFAYIALIVSKMLGAFYNIPFYNLIGEEGGVIYSAAYSVYAIFLDITVCGIPSAISIIVSDYNAKGEFGSKRRAYSLALKYVSIVSLLLFAILQVFAGQFAYFFIGDMTEGVALGDIAMAIRSVAFCLLIAPILSVRRGYLSGHKYISVSSTSQVIEQFVHIGFALAGVYIAVRIMHMSTTIGVCLALVSTAVGAIAGFFYLMLKTRHNKAELNPEDTGSGTEADKTILRKIFGYCITLTIVTVSQSVYCLVDLKMLLVGLHKLGFSDSATQIIASVNSTWTPKISMIIATLAMGMVSSIAPHMAESYAKGDLKDVNSKLNQAMGTMFLICVPLCVGIILYAEPVYRFFFGSSDYGWRILILSVIVTTIANVASVAGMAMQSIRRGKYVCLFSVTGILVNMVFDLPLIFLLNRIGLPAYLGACAASMLGQLSTSTLLLTYMKRTMGFEYRTSAGIFVKVIPAAAAMGIAVALLKVLWPFAEGRGIVFILHLAIVGLIGVLVYFPIAHKTGALHATLGDEYIDNILRRLHLKR